MTGVRGMELMCGISPSGYPGHSEWVLMRVDSNAKRIILKNG